MRFVLVNERTVRASNCTHCSTQIGLGYLREIPSCRLYCDYACYTGKKALSIRAVSRAGAGTDGLPVLGTAEFVSSVL